MALSLSLYDFPGVKMLQQQLSLSGDLSSPGSPLMNLEPVQK